MQDNIISWKKIVVKSVLLAGVVLGLAYGYFKLFALWLPASIVEYRPVFHQPFAGFCIVLSLVTWLGIFNLIIPRLKTTPQEKKDEK